MLDTHVRPLIDPPLNAVGRRLARAGVTANQVTLTGLVAGVMAAVAVAFGAFTLAIVLILLNRIADGLDGAVARASQQTDSGGFIDIVADYVFYASVPVAFAIVDPAANAVAAAALLASFCLTCSSFLAFAILAAKRGIETEDHGKKSFFYSTSLIEGTETIAFFLVMALLPAWFAPLAWMLCVLCLASAWQRTLLALKTF
ncbi:MAG: CDP-alcohol phosphatidyltransferase family protein [Pseudomonadota bacterium]